MRRSVPTTPNWPSLYSMSASAVSSTCAAIVLPLASSASMVLIMAWLDRHGRTRADRRIARDLHRRIAVPVLDLRQLDAEPFGHHRIEHGGVALPGRLDVEVEQQLVAARETDLRAFERKAAGVLQHAGDAEAAVLAALGGFTAALLEAVVVGERQRLVEDDLELAAVDRGADRGLVGHGLRLDQVAAAQLDRIDAGDARGLVDHAARACSSLPAGRRRDRAPSCTVLVNTHLRFDVDQLDVVHAGQAAREIDGLDVGADRADIGAHGCRGGGCAARGTCRCSSSASSTSLIGVARVVVAEERLPSGSTSSAPAGRSSSPPTRMREIFRIGAGLQPERAADVLGDDAQLGVGHAQDRALVCRASRVRSASRRAGSSCRRPDRSCAVAPRGSIEATTMR